MAIYELKCFGTGPGEGNAALVMIDGPAAAEERQAFAKSANKSACVFIDGATLDYYYPHARSPLCLHATLAAARVLLADSPGPMTVHTAMHGQQLVLTRSGDRIFVSLAPQPAPQVTPPADLAERLLAAPGLATSLHPPSPRWAAPKCWLRWPTAPRCTRCARTWPRLPAGARQMA